MKRRSAVRDAGAACAVDARGRAADASGYTGAEEVVHALTHGAGLVLSVGGLLVLVVAAGLYGSVWHRVGAAVFGSSLVACYAASTLYHAVREPRAKRVLQRIDHAAIFVLIAGTYTPFTLVSLRGSWGWSLLASVWGLAILGIALQTTIPHLMRRLSVVLYLAMGWLAVVVLEPLARTLGADALALLVLGGVTYSVGVVFYAWRRLPYHHAIWHVFVLAGSACHWACVFGYLIPRA